MLSRNNLSVFVAVGCVALSVCISPSWLCGASADAGSGGDSEATTVSGGELLLATTGVVVSEDVFKPYIAVITGDDVNIRSGPAQPYYASGRLPKGQTVIVRGENAGWARVDPTPQCFCYISKDYVKLRDFEGYGDVGLITDGARLADAEESAVVAGESAGAGDIGKVGPPERATVPPANQDKLREPIAETAKEAASANKAADVGVVSTRVPVGVPVGREVVYGIVTGDRVRVRAGSLKVPPANANQIQGYLNEGDIVKIIGHRDNYYKIVCLPTSHFWVSLDYVKREGVLTVEAESDMRSQAGLAVLHGVDAVGSTDDAFNRLHKDRVEYRVILRVLQAQRAKPLDDQDLETVRQQLDKFIAATHSPSIKASAAVLDRQLKALETARHIWQKSQDEDEKLRMTLAKIDEKLQRVAAIDNPPEKHVDEMVIKGRLVPSAVFTVEKGNARYLVLDDTERIKCYAISASDKLDLALWVGQDVGLVGVAQYDAYSGIRVLYVSGVVKAPTQNN